MHRIDVPSASTSLPAPRAYGTPGYFQEGNPLTGVDATIVDEDWTNAVQEELVAIVLAAGMSLDKTNRAQVLAAIRSLIAASHGLMAFWGLATSRCRPASPQSMLSCGAMVPAALHPMAPGEVVAAVQAAMCAVGSPASLPSR